MPLMVVLSAVLAGLLCQPVAGGLSLDASFATIRKLSAGIRDDIVRWRRELHSKPELMYQEHGTSSYIQEALHELGVSFTSGWGNNTRQERIVGSGGTGVVAEIGSGGQPIVALRADIDALPIQEETPVPFQSQHKGRMHACGHDGHTSMLLGAAKLLKPAARELPGTVRLIFQPAEEGGAGAKRMCEEGVLKGVSRIFGLHVIPELASGSIGGRAGVLLAAGDNFEFEIVGKGGHGAMPHLAADPVVAAAAVIQSLQTFVSRETDPRDSAVLSVTKLVAGGLALNVIPGRVALGGTIRALTEAGLDVVRRRLVEIATAVASAHRCGMENLTFMPDHFPPTLNDPSLWQWLGSREAGVNQSDGPQMRWDLEPVMGSEDFAFYSQEVPGAFIFLGQGSAVDTFEAKNYPTNVSVHSPRYHMDESVLDLGTALHTHLALRSLSVLASSSSVEL